MFVPTESAVCTVLKCTAHASRNFEMTVCDSVSSI